MTGLRPWVGFENLVEGLARLQARARDGIRQTLSGESVPALPAGGKAENVIEADLGVPEPIDPTAKETSC